ncbi:MAG: AzlD domain-containing protein [Demequina sp.]|jgi:branched-subunit amino acid transport protein|nr:AzlD domain-containing protein [Demequina sp.]
MTPYSWTWIAIVAAAALAWGIKLAGHSVPESWLENPRIHRIAGYITVAMLAALFAVQGFTTKGQLVLDSRLAAVIVAVVLLWRKAPFWLVVLAAAVTAAVLRAAGLP